MKPVWRSGGDIDCNARLYLMRVVPLCIHSQLHLSYSGVSSQDLRSLSSVCAGPNVTTLDVSGNPGVDDDGLIALLKACPNIDTIYAYDTKITDKSIEPEMAKRDIGLRVSAPPANSNSPVAHTLRAHVL